MWDVEWLTATNRSFVLLPYSTQLWRMKFSGYIIWNSLSFCILPTSTHIVTIFPFPLHYFNYTVLGADSLQGYQLTTYFLVARVWQSLLPALWKRSSRGQNKEQKVGHPPHTRSHSHALTRTLTHPLSAIFAPILAVTKFRLQAIYSTKFNLFSRWTP